MYQILLKPGYQAAMSSFMWVLKTELEYPAKLGIAHKQLSHLLSLYFLTLDFTLFIPETAILSYKYSF